MWISVIHDLVMFLALFFFHFARQITTRIRRRGRWSIEFSPNNFFVPPRTQFGSACRRIRPRDNRTCDAFILLTSIMWFEVQLWFNFLYVNGRPPGSRSSYSYPSYTFPNPKRNDADETRRGEWDDGVWMNEVSPLRKSFSVSVVSSFPFVS